MRKITLFLVLGLFYYFPSFAIGDYYVNDTLIVHSPGGANFYGQPNPKKQKLSTIPYGSAVVVAYDSFRKKSAKMEPLEDFQIKGSWVYVKYDGKVGYVFDGYLSKLPAYSLLGDHKLTKKFYTPEKHYLAFMLGRLGQKKDIRSKDCGGTSDCVVGFEQAYNHKVYYKEWYDDNAIQHTVLELSGITNEEAYFLAMELYYGVQGDVVLYHKKKKLMEILPREGEAGCPVRILMDGEFPVVAYDCGLGGI